VSFTAACLLSGTDGDVGHTYSTRVVMAGRSTCWLSLPVLTTTSPALLKDIFVRYLAEGATLGTVVAALKQHGTLTSHGRRYWSRSSLPWMLRAST
jgi:hypothetical protein